ncbi:MAG: hypothetical protein KIT11_01350 [Fimbriimonadaceae bacterium]|nr:hypothetical protein [Fimbriimonadaceae bacterium]QYK54981.1 MAG: hypothetical protein KF733_08185 [Fimbriimonadaceae bacterium]
MTRTLWLTLLAAAILLLAGCQQPPASEDPATPGSPAPATTTGTVSEVQAEKPAGEPVTPVEKKAEKPKGDVSKADPKLFGTYKLMLTAAQMKQIDDELAKVKAAAAAGEKDAAAALPMIEQAAQAAKNMTLTFTKDARYKANLPGQAAIGAIRVNGKSVTLVPDDPPEAGSGLPPETVVTFDAAKGTLTMTSPGDDEVMTFKKQ